MFPFLLARRFLSRQKGTFSAFIIRLAILATGLGVAVMVVSTAFISGFKYAIRSQLSAFWGQVLVVPYDADQTDIVSPQPVQFQKSFAQAVGHMSHVVSIAPFALRPAIVQAGGEMEGIRLKGVAANNPFSPGITFSGQPVHYPDTGYSSDILLSRATAARLQLKPGDAVRAYFLESGAAVPRIRKLTVAGLYHTGMDEVDRQFALCDLRLIQHLSSWPAGSISGYQVALDNPMLADTMAAQIQSQYVQPPLAAQSITAVYEGVFSWLGTQDTNGHILLIIVGIVAIINLGAALLILMVDRTVAIALLKALGMPFRTLRLLFLYLSGLIGACGILLGNALGLGLCWLQLHHPFIHLPEETYNLSTVPVRIEGWQVAAIDGGTLLLCAVCMLLPALYIRRIQPARALQFK